MNAARTRAGATTVAWLSLGSNLGHRGRALECLRRQLEAQGLTIDDASAEIMTRALIVTRQPDFHNQVVRVSSPRPLEPSAWLDRCQRVEQACGRRPTYRYGPRRADCDILMLGGDGEVAVNTDTITVPHPGLGDREYLHRLLDGMGSRPRTLRWEAGPPEWAPV